MVLDWLHMVVFMAQVVWVANVGNVKGNGGISSWDQGKVRGGIRDGPINGV